ncbi:MAG: ThuA domain-containing protein [Gammaproteobacteria bacterium]|nr:ThuA domain-containing protein [Gammaproteobacteria bacterium]
MNRRQMISRAMATLGAGAAMGLNLSGPAAAKPPAGPAGGTAAGRAAFMQRYMRRPGRKNLLAWAPAKNGVQHNSISHAISVLERLGYVSGLYDTYIHTDSQPITLHGMLGSYGQQVMGRDLNNYDAIVCIGVREVYLTERQRADLLQFIRNGGGFLGVHAASTMFLPWHFGKSRDEEAACGRTFEPWPEFNEMLGAEFVEHPYGVIEAPVIVDDPRFPATRFLPPKFNLRDEMYEFKSFSRERMDVVLRLDSSRLDLQRAGVTDRTADWPLAWAKSYGRGRVFYCALGHSRVTWDVPDIQRIYFEALKWTLRLEDADVAPHPLREVAAAAVDLPPAPPPAGPEWAVHAGGKSV